MKPEIRLDDRLPEVIAIDEEIREMQQQRDRFEQGAVAAQAKQSAQDREHAAASDAALRAGKVPPVKPLPVADADQLVGIRDSFMWQLRSLRAERTVALAAGAATVREDAIARGLDLARQAQPLIRDLRRLYQQAETDVASYDTCRRAAAPEGHRFDHDEPIDLAEFVSLANAGGRWSKRSTTGHVQRPSVAPHGTLRSPLSRRPSTRTLRRPGGTGTGGATNSAGCDLS